MYCFRSHIIHSCKISKPYLGLWRGSRGEMLRRPEQLILELEGRLGFTFSRKKSSEEMKHYYWKQGICYFTISEKIRCVDAVSHIWLPLLTSNETKCQMKIILSTKSYLAYERAKSRIWNNERGHRVPVVPQLVQIFSKVVKIFFKVVLVVHQVVLADSKVGLVLLEMVHAASIVGLVVSLVEFILPLIAFIVGVVVVIGRWMQKRVFHFKVGFWKGNGLFWEENNLLWWF